MADTSTPAVPTITPDQAESYAALLEKMSAQSKETSEHIKDLGASIQEMLGLSAKNTNKEVESVDVVLSKLSDFRRDTQAQLGEMQKMHEEHGISVTGNLQKAAAAYGAAIEKIKSQVITGALGGAEAKILLAEFEREAKEVNKRIADDAAENKKRGALGQVGDAASASFGGGSGLGQATSSILSAIPAEIRMGGIAGLFLYGISSAAAVNAQGADLAQSFRSNIGQATSAITGLKGDLAGFSQALQHVADVGHVSSGELAGIYETLRQNGVSSMKEAGLSTEQLTAAMDDTGVTTAGLTDNLGVLSLAMDKALKLQTGTTAKEAAGISRDLGLATGEATAQFYKLSTAARDSNEDIGRYTSSVMVAARSLAQYGVDLSATTELMSIFAKQDAQTHGALASKAIQGVGQMAAGIASNTGMSAFIAEEIVKKQGHVGSGEYAYKPTPGADIDALAARRALTLSMGAGGKEGREALTSMLGVIQGVARQSSPDRIKQEFTIEKMFPGLGQAGAAMVMKLSDKDLADIAKGGTGGLTSSQLKEVKAGFDTSRDRENPFQQFIKALMAAIKDILMGILHGVVGTAQYLAAGITGDKSAAQKNISLAGGDLTRAKDVLTMGAKGLGKGFEGLFGFGEEATLPKAPPTAAQAKAAKDLDKQRRDIVHMDEKEFARTHSGYVPVGSGSGRLNVYGGTEFEHDPQTGGRVIKIEVRDTPQGRKASDRNRSIKSGVAGNG